jgi:myo-inositol-1(or 4)-monophosphatase
MQPMVNIALRAARLAGEQIARAVERLDLIKSEQQGVAEFLNETCVQAERTIVHTIQKAYPSHTIVGEYSGEHAPLQEGLAFIWNINPIDSITNFANGLPVFAISMSGHCNNKIEHAIVLNPMAGEEFTCSRGYGAHFNGKRLRVSNRKTIQGSLIGTGFIGRTSDKPYLNEFQEMFRNIILADGKTFNGGSPALNLAYTAAGRLDGFFQIGLQQNEIEAGMLLLQEAGGLVGDFTGSTGYRTSGNLVAGNPKMFKALLQSIRPTLNESLK